MKNIKMVLGSFIFMLSLALFADVTTSIATTEKKCVDCIPYSNPPSFSCEGQQSKGGEKCILDQNGKCTLETACGGQ